MLWFCAVLWKSWSRRFARRISAWWPRFPIQRWPFDLGAKSALYARAAIPEYWVLDVDGLRLIVHLQPVDGVYQSIQAFSEDEPVQTPLTGESTVVVRDLL